jgi:hypothetical protein
VQKGEDENREGTSHPEATVPAAVTRE